MMTRRRPWAPGAEGAPARPNEGASYRRPLFPAVVGLLLAMPAYAQTVKGTVLDTGSGEPVILAYVGLLAEGGNLVVASLAGDDGGFALEAPSAGSYFLYVARTGYETLMDGVFELGDEGVLDIRVGLKPSPIQLEPIEVEADADVSPLEAVGFYERAAIGRGHFMIREQIEQVAIHRITDAFRRIPTLDVDESRPPIGGRAVMQNPALLIRRGTRLCSPTLYVDRAMVATGVSEPVRPDDWVDTHDVEAIEVYARPVEAPVDFGAVADCGVVLIWTRMR